MSSTTNNLNKMCTYYSEKSIDNGQSSESHCAKGLKCTEAHCDDFTLDSAENLMQAALNGQLFTDKEVDEHMELDVARRIVNKHGYILIKKPSDYDKEVEECIVSEEGDGGPKDCTSCSCNLCIFQHQLEG